jgi:hypothetical protein
MRTLAILLLLCSSSVAYGWYDVPTRPPATPPAEEQANTAPTLLEAWAFIDSGYKRGFDIDDLKEDPPGYLTVPMMQQGGISPPIHYYVKDAKQCVLGLVPPEDHPDWWLEYYLNNAEKYVVSTTSDGQLRPTSIRLGRLETKRSGTVPPLPVGTKTDASLRAARKKSRR